MPGDDRRDDARTAEVTGTGGGACPDGETSGRTGPLSPRQSRRRRHRRLAIAFLLALVFYGVVHWSRAIFRPQGDSQALSIAPALLLEQLCDEAQQQHATTLHITEFAVDDQMVRRIGALHTLETLILDRGVVTDLAIPSIAQLPQLEHLRLRLSPIGDDGLERLAKIESLWYLNLPHAECTAQGVGALAELPRLRQLRLGSANLGNDVSREIARITSLRSIHLIGVAINDEGLKTLAELPHLESLYLDDSAVTEAGWEWLFEEKPHLHVHIDQAHHDRDPRAHRHHD